MFAQESLTRWRAPIPPTHTKVPYLRGNPWLLWEMTPGIRTEMGVAVSVNALGIRGSAITVEKPPGVRRVLIVGDSTVYGHGVEDQATFSARLDAMTGQTVEVLNGGVPGYSSSQTLNLLRMRLLKTDPDVLVIASLWSDNNFDSFVDRELLAQHRSYRDGISGKMFAVLEQSAVFRFLDWKLRLANNEKAVNEVGWMLGREPQGHRRRVAVNDYARNLQTMCELMHANGGEVVFLTLANRVDLGAKTTGAHAWTLYRDVMSDIAQQNAAPVVDVVSAFQLSELNIDTLFLDEMHPTADGHELIAEALSTALSPWLNGESLNGSASKGPISRYADPFSDNSGTNSASGPAPKTDALIVGTVLSANTDPLQIDALDLENGQTASDSRLVGSTRLNGPGEFSLRVPSGMSIGLLVYRDSDGDGPTVGDERIDFLDQAVNPTQKNASVRVLIDLDARSLAHP